MHAINRYSLLLHIKLYRSHDILLAAKTLQSVPKAYRPFSSLYIWHTKGMYCHSLVGRFLRLVVLKWFYVAFVRRNGRLCCCSEAKGCRDSMVSTEGTCADQSFAYNNLSPVLQRTLKCVRVPFSENSPAQPIKVGVFEVNEGAQKFREL